jgi:hypothetical protein
MSAEAQVQYFSMPPDGPGRNYYQEQWIPHKPKGRMESEFQALNVMIRSTL